MRVALQRMAGCLRFWPQLAACYLLGLLGRTAAIELAALAGHDNDLWASLIMPLAGLARLGSFVAMFLVLRPALPELTTGPAAPRRPVNLFGSVVVPLTAIYLAWRMFAEDWIAFEARALTYRAGEAMAAGASTELHPDALPVGNVTWIVIVAALLARVILSNVGDRLPRWVLPVRVYVDFLWVFLVLTFSVNKGLTLLTNPAGWVSERRIVVWLDHIRDSAFSHVHFLQVLWDWFATALRVVFGGAVMPLLWLAVAGIVYGISSRVDWSDAAHRVGGQWADAMMARTQRHRDAVSQRWKALPHNVRAKARDEAVARVGKFRPVADSARLIAHAGLPALAIYVLASLGLAWLDMSGSFYRTQFGAGYLVRGMAWLLGPHSAAFWAGTTDTLVLISHLIIEPVRICLVATMFAYCVRHVRRPVTAAVAA